MLRSGKLYKDLIRHANKISNTSQKDEILDNIRARFRASINERNPEKIEELIKGGEQRLAFMKTYLIPKDPTNYSATGKQVFRVKDNEVIEGSPVMRKGMRDFVDQRIEADQLERHQHLLKRQYYMTRPEYPHGIPKG